MLPYESVGSGQAIEVSSPELLGNQDHFVMSVFIYIRTHTFWRLSLVTQARPLTPLPEH